MESVYILIGIISLFILFLFGNYLFFARIHRQTKKALNRFEEQFIKKIQIATEIIKEVTSFISYEKDLVDEIVKAKRKAEEAKTFEEKKEAGNVLSMILSAVLRASEKHPDLKASQKIMQLRKELKEIEEGIDSTKEIYLESLQSLKKLLKKRPFNVFFSFLKKDKVEKKETIKKKKVKRKISKDKTK